MPLTKTRVLVVDDHGFVREGLRARLALEPDLEWVGSLESAQGLLPQVEATTPGVILLDIDMPGSDTFAAMEELRVRFPGVKVLMLSAHIRDTYIDAAVKAGAWGYMAKSDSTDSIIDGIRKVARGEFAFGADAMQRSRPAKVRRNGIRGRTGPSRPAAQFPVPTSRLGSLTERELEILRLMGKGLQRTEIAETIERSAKTVDAHRTSLMQKLDIHDTLGLTRFAIREGLAQA
jgi:NarL family two-component system response regulator LiaR